VPLAPSFLLSSPTLRSSSWTPSAIQAAQTGTITQATVYAADGVTGLALLLLGQTGAANLVAKSFPRYIVIGIVLGLGLGFMLSGFFVGATTSQRTPSSVSCQYST